MAVVNVLIQEDELTSRITNDFAPLYNTLRNQLYSDNNTFEGNMTAYVQIASSFIHVFKSMLEFIPNVILYREKFDDGILDSENYEVVTFTSEHEEYEKVLFAALCIKYREALTALIISASEDIQTDPAKTLVLFTTSDNYGWKNPDAFGVCLEMFSEIRQFVKDIILADVSVLDYIINVAPILADTSVGELIWKRYLKHCAKSRLSLAVNNLVVGKLMVIDRVERLAGLLDDAFKFVTDDKSIELDESSLLYYKVNSHVKNDIVFEHRLGPYAQALFANDVQQILSTPVIEGNIDKNYYRFGFRSKFIPVNQPTGESLKDAKCEGLLAQFAS
jgi:hypothetical protein